jgi:cell division protein FtsQ
LAADNGTAQTLYKLGTALYWLAGGLLLYAALAWVLSLPVFGLRTVQVAGHLEHVSEAQVRLITQRVLRGNFFTVDMEAAREGFEKLPWVREAKVARLWPSVLVVRVTENVPFARWGKNALVNPQGEVFDARWPGNLPQFDGPDGSSQEVMAAYQRYEKILAPLGSSLVSIDLSPRLAWRLRLANGLELALGREEADARLARFAVQYRALQARLGSQLRYVDLRYPDGFAVKLAPARTSVAAPMERS